MTQKESPRQVPLKVGLFCLPSAPGEKGYLIGSRCRSCGEAFYPKRFYCAQCTSADMEEVALGQQGRLETFTISRMVPPGSLMLAPYALGIIRLPEGAQVTSVITDCDLEKLDIGQEMELVIEKIKEDEAGNEVMVFKFRPV